MRSKAPLALIEQVIMILVFALAAVLCLRAFVWSDAQSALQADRDRAVVVAQRAAENLKAAGGDMAHAQAEAARRMGGVVEQGVWYVLYDQNWTAVGGYHEAAYAVYAQGVPIEVNGLWKAEVWVASCDGDGAPLFSLDVAWQEVNLDGE